MPNPPQGPAGRVFVVDDDTWVLDSLRQLLTRRGFEVRTYASPREFLHAARVPPPCCVLLDVEMPDMTGLEVQKIIERTDDALPIVFMTGHPDVPRAVGAMKSGAIDFLLKPFTNEQLFAAVDTALRHSTDESGRLRARRDAQSRIGRLTPRERQVCAMVASGMTSKEISVALGASENTINVHRQRILSKTQVDSLPDLVRLYDLASGGAAS